MNPADLIVEIVVDKTTGMSTGSISNTIKVTHVPTGLVAVSSYGRSQHKNRHIAMSMIEYGLAEMEYFR